MSNAKLWNHILLYKFVTKQCTVLLFLLTIWFPLSFHRSLISFAFDYIHQISLKSTLLSASRDPVYSDRMPTHNWSLIAAVTKRSTRAIPVPLFFLSYTHNNRIFVRSEHRDWIYARNGSPFAYNRLHMAATQAFLDKRKKYRWIGHNIINQCRRDLKRKQYIHVIAITDKHMLVSAENKIKISMHWNRTLWYCALSLLRSLVDRTPGSPWQQISLNLIDSISNCTKLRPWQKFNRLNCNSRELIIRIFDARNSQLLWTLSTENLEMLSSVYAKGITRLIPLTKHMQIAELLYSTQL